jgi:hypothetical protein
MTPSEILISDFLSDFEHLLNHYGFQTTQETVEFVHKKLPITVVYERPVK